MKNKLIGKIILNLNAQSTCRRATFLIEKQQHDRLSVREWLTMQAHLAICPLCTVYKSQSTMLQQMIRRIFEKRVNGTISMDEVKKQQLEQLLKDRSGKEPE